MQRSVRLERLLLGFRGLALLRGWPLGDEAEADRQLDAIESLVRRRRESPMSEVYEVTEFDHAAGYAAWAETYDDENNLIDIEERCLRRILERYPAGDAADIACGTGRVSAMLSELGHRVTGVDPSEEMLTVARAKGLDVTFIAGDFATLPLSDDSFDLVTCTLALTHVADLRGPMAEMARIVRPSGKIVLSDIHPIAVATGGQAVFRRADGTRGATTNLQHWTSDYVAAFGDARLAIEDCVEPLVDDDFIGGLKLEPVREGADLALRGLPCLLLWVLAPVSSQSPRRFDVVRADGHPAAMDLVGKNFADARDVTELPLLREEVVEVGGFRIGREVTEPGWRWSEHARPTLGGDWCQDRHIGLTVSGRWGVSLPDGRSIEYGAGDVFDVPAGHDSWTIGDERCVTVTWTPVSDG